MSLIKTRLQDIRVKYPNEMDSQENRVTQTGLLEVALESTNSPDSIVSGDLKEKVRGSQGRIIDIPVLNKGLVTISNVRTCTITAGRTTSNLVRVVWKTIVSNILMVPGEYDTNMISYEADFAHKLRELVEAWKIEMEEDIESALDANKSQVYNSSIATVKYAPVGNALQVEPDEVDLFFGDLNAINFADDFYNPKIKIVANHTVMPVVDFIMNQGQGNSRNTAYQFPGKDFTFSNRIENGPEALATGYFFPNGAIGIVTRTDRDAQRRSKATSGVEWFEDRVAGLPFPVGVMYKSDCQDKSLLEANGFEHLTATLVEQYQFSVDYAILVPYNTNLATKSSAIRKFEFVEEVV